MPSRRTSLALLAAAAVVAAGVLLGQACRRDGAAAPLPVDDAPAHIARAAGLPASAAVAAAVSLTGTDLLEAVRTVDRFCKLVSGDRRRAACRSLATPRVWPRSQLRTLRGLRLRSARLVAVPDVRTVVVRTRVNVHARAGCRLRDGINILFFTLGRVGTTTGGWLISAVSTRP